MGCFSSKGVEISRYREEDRIARQKREEDEQIELEKAKIESLKQAEEDEKKRRLEEEKRTRLEESKEREEEEKRIRFEESKEKGKTKEEEEKRQIKDLTLSICNGCKSEIGDGISVNAFGHLWHPQCLCCLHCHKPLDMKEIFNTKRQFHKPCYEEYLKCYICDKKLPRTEKGREFMNHEFWKEKYCPCHDDDGIAKCCSCERLESCGTKYVMLPDDRWLCLECMECAVMDTDECVDLHIEIREFFASLSLEIEKEFHLFLVEREALNEAEKKENIDNDQYGIITRGICLSEEHTIPSVTKGPRMGPNKQLITNIVTQTQRVTRKCEVTAILILYGLPRILTGAILAHEMMHAWLRLNGYQNLNLVLEEGLCQVLAHMWLEPQTYATPDPLSASSSSHTPPVATTLKKGDRSDFEKRLVEFCKYQIETDNSPVYGLGFKKVNQMMLSNHYNIKDTIKDIVSASKATPESKI